MDLGSLLGLDVEALDEGGATVRLEVDERHLNPGGTVHGGTIATLCDTAMGAAVAAGAGEQRPVTVEMKVSYLEAAGPGLLTATAQVRRRGSRLTILEAEVEQGGEVVAFATATFTTV